MYDEKNKIGIMDPEGKNLNPLNNKEYSEKYKNLSKLWSNYPAFDAAKTVFNSIDKNQLTFIVSGTGSGKTVLIPKFALHYFQYTGKVAITLPKRAVTLSSSAFSAATLDVDLGKEVGYVYKGSPKEMLNEKNRLVYMTDGTLVMKFVKDPLLTEFNCIIIDEAHERKVQIDIILLLLKELLQSGKRPDLKVIIMSATVDTKKYLNYFSGVKSNVVNISGQPNYPIEVKFLDNESYNYIDDTLELFYELKNKGVMDDILIFVTSSGEAKQMCKEIRNRYSDVFCIELYAELSDDMKIYAEKKDKYKELGDFKQKVVISTNVAESSITIDGLKIVIDTCYELGSYYEPDHMANILEKRLITKAQAYQRRGRVGRTESGICYHMLTKKQFDSLEEYPEPDILKHDITMDLLKIISTTKTQTFVDGMNIMKRLMDVPTEKYIAASERLFEFYNILDNGKLTQIGSDMLHFSSLSVNRILFLLYAYQHYCGKEACQIVGMMEATGDKISNIIQKHDVMCGGSINKTKKLTAKEKIMKMANKKSDHLTFLNIFQEFKKAEDRRKWALNNGFRYDIFKKADKISAQYFNKLMTIKNIPKLERSKNQEIKEKIIKVLSHSHKHHISTKMSPVVALYNVKKIYGMISKDSIVGLTSSAERKKVSMKTFIYDDLIRINGLWEYTCITII